MLLLTHILAPATATCATRTASCWRVHPEELLDPNGRNARIWDKLNQGQRVKAAKVSHDWVAAGRAPITFVIGEWVHVDATVTGHGKALLVLERLAAKLQVLNLDLADPLRRDLKTL